MAQTPNTVSGCTPASARVRRLLLASVFVALSPLTAWAAGPVNANAQGIAIKGYDPVAYFVDGKATKGNAEFSAKSSGATYWFASLANQQAFRANPQRYEPQYGGYCAFGVAKGAKPDIDPTAFAIVDGKLYLILNHGIQKRWQTDIATLIEQANTNWPSLKAQ